VHLADRFDLPEGYTARPYRGAPDHAAMAPLLTAYREAQGDPESVIPEHLDQSYRNLTDCDPDLDIAMIEFGHELVAYNRPTFAHVSTGTDLVVFPPIHPDHAPELFDSLAAGQEAHLRKWIRDDQPSRYRAYAGHPGPGETPTGEAAWLEARGYATTEWGASLRRPHLDDIPDLPLPDGIEVRPVTPDQVRHIVEVHHEAFRGDWDFTEITQDDVDWIVEDPHRDETLWQVAWDGDIVVGQVKPFINHAENAQRGYLRGYTEYISTHRDYRNRGIAKALLARALRAIAARGMTEAVLGVDTNNPGGAFQLYQGLGFVLESYAAVYTKPVD
jgi:ribosomal protein S18 acetylase RimI-like enzyme